jgi:hypothetical protein
MQKYIHCQFVNLLNAQKLPTDSHLESSSRLVVCRIKAVWLPGRIVLLSGIHDAPFQPIVAFLEDEGTPGFAPRIEHLRSETL